MKQCVLQAQAKRVSGRSEDFVDELESGLEGVFCQQHDQPGGDDDVQECVCAGQVVVVHAPYSAEVLSCGWCVRGLAIGSVESHQEPGRPGRGWSP